MDYWLTDSYLHPPGTEEIFTEELYRLPVFYQYQGIKGAPPINTPPAGRNGFVTFGSFNNPAKINPEVIKLWAQVLKAVSGSQLIIKYKNFYSQESLQESILEKHHNGDGLNIDEKSAWHGSLKVACELFAEATNAKKSILFFVHGYNNDVEDVIKAAQAIEALYNVIVVPFTWPANGGGAVSGLASYKSDKADGRQSTGALNRVVGKIKVYHELLTQAQRKQLRDLAIDKHPDNAVAQNSLFTRLQEKACESKISLLCHSMGNYVLKHTLMTSDRVTSKLVFDNICLVAADTNNKDHKDWVSRLDVRNRCYVVINEKDSALKASRIKPGDEQLARLGHYTRELDSPNAYYIDVTNAHGVGEEHTYFKGESVINNNDLKSLFQGMFNGQSVENKLKYLADKNSYVMK